MKLFFTAVTCLISLWSQAQYIEFDWAVTVGGVGGSVGRFIANDIHSNVYTTGTFTDTVDFDPGPGIYELGGTGNDEDLFIQKMDSNGHFIWARVIASNHQINVMDLAVDDLGSVYVAGWFKGAVDFDPDTGIHKLVSGYYQDGFVVKLDSTGKFQWVVTYGAVTTQSVTSLTLDKTGNLYIVGDFEGTVDFDPGPGVYTMTALGVDFFITRLDTAGNFKWANVIGGPGIQNVDAVETDIYGDLVIAGVFSITTDFDPGPAVFNMTSQGSGDCYVLKLDTAANFIWARSFGGLEFDYPKELALDNNGNIFVAGIYEDSANFDPGVTDTMLIAKADEGSYLLKMDRMGAFSWVRGLGGMGIGAINTDADRNVWVGGRFSSQVDFDPGLPVYNLTPKGQADIYLLKLDSSGNFLWVKSSGGTKSAGINDMDFDRSENLLLTGSYSGTVDFDLNPLVHNMSSHAATVDVFVMKLANTQCPVVTGTDVIEACDEYTWLDGITYFQNTDDAVYYLPGAAVNGCDSFLLLDLTINRVNNKVSFDYRKLTASQTLATYQWLDCDNDLAIVPGATDREFIPSANGHYAVAITFKGCTDTSACYEIKTVGMEQSGATPFIHVFPNPATGGVVNVDLGDLQDVSISICTMGGQVIYSRQHIGEAVHQLQLEDLSGLFIIEIVAEGIIERHQLVIH